jgi:L-iditol 2-dehydrogenase
MVQLDPRPGDVLAVLGQGPVGLIFSMMAKRTGTRIVTTDTMSVRRDLSRGFGAEESFDPRTGELDDAVRKMTNGRGADLVIVAASAKGIVEQAIRCTRPGARILLFAQTSHEERIEMSGASICMEERTLCGSYSASVDLQKESADMVFSGELPVEQLISHRFPLDDIHVGIDRALHPDETSLKIVVQPQRWVD